MAQPVQEVAKTQQEQIVEEDEFEEFEVEDWDASAEDPQQAHLWEADWDDDDISDDFGQRLKAELARQMQQAAQQQPEAPK